MPTLYVVATPIGHRDDITLRALQILRQVDTVAAEDTRHTRALLDHHGISARLVSYREHNEERASAELIARLQAGESFALVSDAGTPLISDPGYRLVREARLAGIDVVPVPGANAAITALSVAGLATDRFCFEGFLAARGPARRKQLMLVRDETRTLVFYEAPHRIVDLMADMVSVFGEAREVVIGRELTKKFEQLWSGSAAAAVAALAGEEIPVRGEFVVLVAGALPADSTADETEQFRVLSLLLPELPPKKAAELTASITGGNKKDLYAQAVAIKQSKG
ncbi:MAG: 16S rRNA (cytidine(1402)-2'-O)-methyltransferase [Pseudomonadales bacterium]|nr:16S rRNA (cytidine(1402)-2'-O)-methyltransferase [Pseudomonadales bacterium]